MRIGTEHIASLQPVRHRCAGTVWTVALDGRGEAECAFCARRASRIGPPAPIGPTAAILGRVTRDLHRFKKRLRWVLLAPEADPFAPSAPELAGPALEIAGLLLRNGVGVTLRTRGGVDEARGLITLARRHPGLLRVEIGLFSMDRELVARWERGAATTTSRLALATSLKRAGADVIGRVGPIVPLVNDGERAMTEVSRAFVRAGVRTLVPAWVEGAPGLVKQVEREVSRSAARMLSGWFSMGRPKPRAANDHPSDLFAVAERRGSATPGGRLPTRVRRHVLDRLRAAAGATGADLVVCACSDAVQGEGGACLSGPSGAMRGGQLDLFARSG